MLAGGLWGRPEHQFPGFRRTVSKERACVKTNHAPRIRVVRLLGNDWNRLVTRVAAQEQSTFEQLSCLKNATEDLFTRPSRSTKAETLQKTSPS